MALATAVTTLRIPVDVAGGHVFKGHTLASSDLLCLLTPTGWKVVSATYADNAQQTYCTATISVAERTPHAYGITAGMSVMLGLIENMASETDEESTE